MANCQICGGPISLDNKYLEDLDTGNKMHVQCYQGNPVKMEVNYVTQCDAIDGVGQLPDDSVDYIALDPPYPFHERKGGPTARCQNWFPSFDGSNHSGWKRAHTDPTTEQEPRFMRWFEDLLYLCADKLKDGHYMTIFATEYFADKVKPLIGPPLVYRKEWIWDKMDFATGYYGRQQHEYILCITKGKKPFKFIQDVGTILEAKRVKNGYPTEKPVGLYDQLIQRTMEGRGLVLDPCCGSGNSLVSAVQNGHYFIGYDIWKKAVNISLKNLNSA